MDPTIAPAYDAQSQNDLIAKQFGQARKNLLNQKSATQDQNNMAVDRNQAISGLSGGTVAQLKTNANNQADQNYAANEATLSSEEAGAKQQAGQFAAQYGLQNAQFNESKNQFAQQMKYQYAEFGENQKTNLLNAVNALKKLGENTSEALAFAKNPSVANANDNPNKANPFQG